MRTGRPPYSDEIILKHGEDILALKVKGLMQKEIAEELGITNLTIRQRLKRYHEVQLRNG